MRRALAIDGKNYGPSHTKVATNLDDFARLLQNPKRPAAEELLAGRTTSS
jgi:hypothetical protein